MRFRAAAVCLAGLCVGLAAPSATSAALQKSIWGPSTLPAGNLECPAPRLEPCSAFPAYSELGVDVFQFRLAWSDIAAARPASPTDPADFAYRWPPDIDAAVREASSRGIGLAARVEGTPAWANGGLESAWAPASATDYADFLVAASRRYPQVSRWMIWGEPNRAEYFQPNGRNVGPRRYAELLDAAYGAIKGVDPSDLVVGGMTDNFGTVRPATWVRNLHLANGRRPRMDEYGHNPFDNRFPNIRKVPIGAFRGLNDIDTTWHEVRHAYHGVRRGRPRKLWLSEWTLQTDHDSSYFPFHVGQDQQAVWLTAAYALARRAPYVSGLGWYRLDDAPGNTDPAWGLETDTGARKPSFAAYAAVP